MTAGDGPWLDPAAPGWDWDTEAITRLSRDTVELLAATLLRARTGPLATRPPADQLEAWRTDDWADAGMPVERVLAEYAATIAPYPFGNAHPRYAAWVNSPPHPLGVAAAALAAAMNPSVAGGNHAAVHLERRVVRWFAQLLDRPGGYVGQLVSGGSAATLTALTAARHRALARVGHDDRRDGITGLSGRLVVYASDEAHSCVTKAVQALGIGSANIHRLPTDAEHRIDPGVLDQILAADLDAGVLPVAVVASAGTVNTGAVDPLPAIADVCARHRVWLHVDGAYGAPPVLLLDDWAGTRAGLARADSLALDAHKWLYVPVDAGLILFRDEANLRDTFSLVPPYLRTAGETDEPVWFSEYGLEQTRPFRALKVWMQLSHLGRDGYRRLIARDIAVAAALRVMIHDSEDFEVLAHGLSVVCFRHHPHHVSEQDLDRHNQALLAQLQTRRVAFLAATTVYGRFALRACIVNPLTTTSDIGAILDEARRCAPGWP
jgi:glutamate/tyrosine decarboxylase-like PLP-dependent enzyme